MSRLDKDRQAELEPKRIEYAIKKIEELGHKVIYQDTELIRFKYKEKTITFFPYSGWASGATIRDGRGLNRLLRQIK